MRTWVNLYKVLAIASLTIALPAVSNGRQRFKYDRSKQAYERQIIAQASNWMMSLWDDTELKNVVTEPKV